MIKSEVVVNASLFLLTVILMMVVEFILPADAVLGHFPGGTFGSVPQVARLDDVLLQRTGYLPLVVVVCWGRRGDVATR